MRAEVFKPLGKMVYGNSWRELLDNAKLSNDESLFIFDEKSGMHIELSNSFYDDFPSCDCSELIEIKEEVVVPYFVCKKCGAEFFDKMEAGLL